MTLRPVVPSGRVAPAAERWWRRLGVGLLAVGAWGLTAPYAAVPLGLGVDVPAVVEVVDHVVPGVAVLAVAGYALRAGRLPLEATLVGLLAGLWMTVTHLPLLAHARHGLVAWPSALFHSLPGIALVTLLGVAAAKAWRADVSPPPQQPGQPD